MHAVGNNCIGHKGLGCSSEPRFHHSCIVMPQAAASAKNLLQVSNHRSGRTHTLWKSILCPCSSHLSVEDNHMQKGIFKIRLRICKLKMSDKMSSSPPEFGFSLAFSCLPQSCCSPGAVGVHVFIMVTDTLNIAANVKAYLHGWRKKIQTQDFLRSFPHKELDIFLSPVLKLINHELFLCLLQVFSAARVHQLHRGQLLGQCERRSGAVPVHDHPGARDQH